MGQGTNLFFNLISVVFLVLTVFVGIVVVGVATGSMDAPVLAPENTPVPPTQYYGETLTPSPMPGIDASPFPATPEAGQ